MNADSGSHAYLHSSSRRRLWSFQSTKATSEWMPSNDASGCLHQLSIQWVRSSTATLSRLSQSFQHLNSVCQLKHIQLWWTRMMITWIVNQVWMPLSNLTLINFQLKECNQLQNRMVARVSSKDVQRESSRCQDPARLIARLSKLSASRKNHPEQLSL